MRSTQGNGFALGGTTILEVPESPKEPSSATPQSMEINRGKTTGVGLVALVLATIPIGALYLMRFDVAKRTPSAPSVKTSIATASSASVEPKVEAVNIKKSRETVGELAHPILVLSDVWYSSGPSSTTVTIDVDEKVQYEINRLTNPDRIYLDLRGSKLDGALWRKKFQVADPVLQAIRVAEHEGNVTRVTLETKRFCDSLLTTVRKSHQLQIELWESSWAELKK